MMEVMKVAVSGRAKQPFRSETLETNASRVLRGSGDTKRKSVLIPAPLMTAVNTDACYLRKALPFQW